MVNTPSDQYADTSTPVVIPQNPTGFNWTIALIILAPLVYYLLTTDDKMGFDEPLAFWTMGLIVILPVLMGVGLIVLFMYSFKINACFEFNDQGIHINDKHNEDALFCWEDIEGFCLIDELLVGPSLCFNYRPNRNPYENLLPSQKPISHIFKGFKGFDEYIHLDMWDITPQRALSLATSWHQAIAGNTIVPIKPRKQWHKRLYHYNAQTQSYRKFPIVQAILALFIIVHYLLRIL